MSGDAWGGSWGSSWALSWTKTGPAPPPPQPVVDTHDGIDPDRGRPDRNKDFREARQALRDVVERSYRLAIYGPEPEPQAVAVATPLTVAGLAQSILPDLRAADITASLSEIEALLTELEGQRMHAARRAADEEAMLVLMLS